MAPCCRRPCHPNWRRCLNNDSRRLRWLRAGFTAGKGAAALDPTSLPQSEGTALRGVLPPELESFKFAQLPCDLHLTAEGLPAIEGACDGLAGGLPLGFEQPSLMGSWTVAFAITCGGTIMDGARGRCTSHLVFRLRWRTGGDWPH